MNSCKVNLSAVEVAKAFVARFYVEAQTSKAALCNGFRHTASCVSYNPVSPFSGGEIGYPFASEDEAHNYCKTMISKLLIKSSNSLMKTISISRDLCLESIMEATQFPTHMTRF